MPAQNPLVQGAEVTLKYHLQDYKDLDGVVRKKFVLHRMAEVRLSDKSQGYAAPVILDVSGVGSGEDPQIEGDFVFFLVYDADPTLAGSKGDGFNDLHSVILPG